jgi:hypothetical protein
MRNALNKLADTVQDPAEKKVSTSPTIHTQSVHADHGSPLVFEWLPHR